tara:strand:+ start:2292 stop:2981 length:690 start_codon:yes stop_codon:yes gene_type:complete
MLKNKNIFITGGNRGIGKGLVKVLGRENNVIFSVRESTKGEEVIKDFKNNKVKYVVLDVDDFESIREANKNIKNEMKTIDILFNNAGILIPEYEVSAVETSEESILKTFQTNTLGPLRIIKSLLDLIPEGGRIVNISSGMGQLDEMEGGSLAYRLSKTSLNALSKILSVELEKREISVNAICPGWVQTDMGGGNATLTIEDSTQKIVAFALHEEFPNGKFLRHGEILPW